jgi:hypothetical protein
VSTYAFSPLRTVAGTAIGVGVGQSVAHAIAPVTQQLANETWSRYQNRPITALQSALLVATGERALADMTGEAALTGYTDTRLEALVAAVDQAPDLATLYELLNRGLISQAEFLRGVKKAAIKDEWHAALYGLRERILSPAEAAAGWQQGYMSEAASAAEAARSGVNADRSLIQRELAGMPPGPETGLDMLRRNIIDESTFAQMIREGNTKTKYIDDYLAIRSKLLSPSEAANAWQQGYWDEAQSAAEALANGVDADRSLIQRELAGNPPGPETGLAMLRRGVITQAVFEQMVREGHTKTKYIPAYLATINRVTSATVAAGLWLRGHVTEAEAKRIGELTGYGAEEMDHLYLNRGRPATTRQVHIGYARGGRLPGAADERAAFGMAVRQSDIRTEYEDVLWAQRYTYPSAFVLRALASDGTFDQATTEKILIESGWVPEYAQTAAAKWAGAATAGPGTKWADRARSRLFTAAHNDFMDGNSDEATARSILQAIGVPSAEQTTIVNLWNIERTRTRRDLTQAQIIKLYKKQVWTREMALAALVDLSMTDADANALLDANAP